MKKLIGKIKFSISFIAILIAFCCISCNSRKEVPVTLKSTLIEGDLSEYFEIVDKPYSLIKQKGDDCYRINIEIKRKDKPFNFGFDIVDLASGGWVKLSCDLYDANGSPTFLAEDVYGSESFDENDVLKLAPGKTGWIEFSYCYKQDMILKTKSIAFKAYIDKSGIPSEVSSQTQGDGLGNEEDITGNSVNKDWDQVLADYEAYTDKYIKLLKKANAGDASAMTEYVEMLGKAQELQESLAGANNVMSMEQLQKFTKIQQKLLSAASGL